jgi:uncharacterized protein (TIGR02246 family)
LASLTISDIPVSSGSDFLGIDMQACKILVCMLLGCVPLCSVWAQVPIATEDSTAIEKRIVQLHEEWNSHDMAAYTGNMTDDVQWVNVVGDWWKGKAQVFQTLDRYHKTIFANRQLHPAENVAIRQIAPDVIVSTMINPADGYTQCRCHAAANTQCPDAGLGEKKRNLADCAGTKHN